MNKQLYDKQYVIPRNIINYVSKALIMYPTGDGVRRANMIKSGTISYQALERIKHDFDLLNTNDPEDMKKYILGGGDLMKNFVLTTLNTDRAGVKMKSDATMDKSDINQGLRAQTINEEDKKEKLKNAIAIIVNGNNKILLLKRANIEGGWGNNLYALAGGHIEKKEKPEEACRREVREETGLTLGTFIERYTIIRDGNTEYVFVSRYNGSDTDIKLNEEHTAYGWFGFDEIKFLDTVPNLKEYLNLCFKKY